MVAAVPRDVDEPDEQAVRVARRHPAEAVRSDPVRRAIRHAQAAGCEWLHVDFEPRHAPFYVDACGFRPTAAGLIHLQTLAVD